MLQLARRRLMPSRPPLPRLPPLLGCSLILTLAAPTAAASASSAFQASFMRQPPGQSAEAGALALQALATQTTLPAGRYRVEILLNLAPLQERDVSFSERRDGRGLQPCIDAALLRDLNLREEALDRPLPDDGSCLDLQQVIPQARVEFDPTRLQLSLSIPQIVLRQDRLGSVPEEHWSEGIDAAFINYQASAQNSSSHGGGSRSSQDLYLNTGINLAGWRLRSKQALREDHDGSRSWTRSDTYAQHDIPGLRANVTLGETFTNNEMFRSVRFKGAQLASDQGMLSDALQHYAPVIRGIAQSRAKIEVFHNGYPIYSTYVAPGPYAIDDLSVGSGHGELEVVITDADGQVRRFTQPYASIGNLLRPGIWRYTATVGRYDGSEHLDNPPFWQATLARGGAWDTTLYGGLLSSSYYNASVFGLARDFAQLGGLSFDVTRADSDRGPELGKVQGHSFAIRYGKSFQTRTNLRFAGYRYSTEGYRDFDEAVRERNASNHYRGNRRSRLEASVYQSIGQRSTLNLTFSQDSYWHTGYQRRQYQVQYTTRMGNLGINLFASQALDSRNSDNRLFGVSLSLPLEFGTPHYATFDLQHDNGRYSERASLNGTLPDSQLNYTASASNDRMGQKSGALSLAYQGSQGSIGMGYTEGSDYRSLSVNASGGLLLHGEGLALSPYLGETMALVHVPEVADLGIQNTPSRTDAKGYALVPYLRPYRSNSLVLETDQLSPQIIIENASQQVVPRRGAVVKAAFEARQVIRMVLTLRRADGQPLPFGAQVIDSQGQTLGVVGQAGQTLLATNTQGQQNVTVRWGDTHTQACQVTLDPQSMPADSGYRLQSLNCHAIHGDAVSPSSSSSAQESL